MDAQQGWKGEVHAKIIRANGEEIDLGCIDKTDMTIREQIAVALRICNANLKLKRGNKSS